MSVDDKSKALSGSAVRYEPGEDAEALKQLRDKRSRRLRCFLSYRFTNQNELTALEVKKFLSLLDVDVLSGETYEPRKISDKVLSKLREPLDLIVLIITADGESMWTRDEVGAAVHNDIPLVPLVEAGSRFDPGLFADVEYVNFESGHIGDAFLKLLQAVNFVRKGASTDIDDADAIAVSVSGAETWRTMPARPWLIIDGYSSGYAEDQETGEEYLWESVRLVNRGRTPAVNIVIPEIQIDRQRARVLRSLPTLGPGESIDAGIVNLRQTLQRVRQRLRGRLPKPRKGSLTLRLPWAIEYRGFDGKDWSTEHAISYSTRGISFEVVHPSDSRQWTDLSVLDQESLRE